MSNAQKILKNTIALSVANSIPRVTQAIVIFVAARVIGDVGLGKYYTIASLITITNVFTDFGITSVLTREVSKYKDQASKYFFNLIIVKMFLGVFAYASLIGITIALDYPIDILKAAYLYGIFMVFWGVGGFFLALFQAFEEMKYNAWISGISSVLNLSISLALLYLQGSFMSPIWGLSVSSVIAVTIAFLFVKRKITFSLSYFDWKFLKYNLKLAFPFALNSFFVSIYFRIDSIILSKLETEQVMGWYGAAYKLLDNLLMLPYFFLGAIYPVLCRVYEESKEHFAELFSQSFKIMAMGAYPISIGLFLTAPKALLLLYGPDFLNSTLSLQILSLALFMIFFTSLGVITLMAMNKMKIVNYVGAFNILLNVTLSFLLIPKKGLGLSLQGAAIATVACEVVGAVVFMMYFARSKMLQKQAIIGSFKPLVASVIMGIVVYITLDYNLLINLSVGTISYLGAMWVLKGFSEKELGVIKEFLKR